MEAVNERAMVGVVFFGCGGCLLFMGGWLGWGWFFYFDYGFFIFFLCRQKETKSSAHGKSFSLNLGFIFGGCGTRCAQTSSPFFQKSFEILRIFLSRINEPLNEPVNGGC
ncbi:MAG: hypothetical protein IJA46_04815 [Bacteroidaceae bacterium]|nr:hypothetical protein [Bacteroidaceae bacterium]